MDVGLGMIIGGGMMGAGSAIGALGSQPGDTEFAPPALGFAARQQYMQPLANQLWGLAQGGGGFGDNFAGQAFQQARSMMAPVMRQAQSSLDFSQMQRGIFDSGAAMQQQGQLQGAFMSSLGRNALDIALKNQIQTRMEMIQAMQMLMGGIQVGGSYQTPATQSSGSIVGQSLLGGMGEGLAMAGLFGGGTSPTPQPAQPAFGGNSPAPNIPFFGAG